MNYHDDIVLNYDLRFQYRTCLTGTLILFDQSIRYAGWHQFSPLSPCHHWRCHLVTSVVACDGVVFAATIGLDSNGAQSRMGA